MQPSEHRTPPDIRHEEPKDITSLELYLLEQMKHNREAERNIPTFLLWIRDFWPIIVFLGASLWWMSGLVTQKSHRESVLEMKQHIDATIKASEERMRLEIRIHVKDAMQPNQSFEHKKKP